MVDTNALLSIAFSIVANFTNVVHVPPGLAPKSTNDLEAYHVGRVYHPVDVYLKVKSGAEFWIMNGAVQIYYYTPGSFSCAQDPAEIPRFLGTPTVSSTQAFALASNVVRRLLKNGDPFAHVAPVMEPAGLYHSQLIPFFEVRWPRDAVNNRDCVARVEVDARSGFITSLALIDLAFSDFDHAAQISNQVYKPDPPRPPPPRKRLLPCPGTNNVIRAIASWLAVCQKLGVDTGSATNLADVDWDETYMYSSPFMSWPTPVTRVAFKNGTLFDNAQPGILSHSSYDRYFVAGFSQRWLGKKQQFRGRVVYSWQELAANFEHLLEREFGMEPQILAGYESRPMLGAPVPGSENFVRLEVQWSLKPKAKLRGRKELCGPSIMVEFDLHTGAIKGFGFREEKIIEDFVRNQRRAQIH